MFNSAPFCEGFDAERRLRRSVLLERELCGDFSSDKSSTESNEEYEEISEDEAYDRENENANPDPGEVQQKRTKRTRQYVATLAETQNCVKWMCEEFERSGRDRLMAKTVDRFPQTFNTNRKADLQRASRYWKKRDEILSTTETPKVFVALVTDVPQLSCCCLSNFIRTDEIFAFQAMTQVQQGVRKRKNAKAINGRGRKRSSWVAWLHREMTAEFERLLNIGVEFSSSTVMLLVQNILARPDSLYRSDYIPEDGLHRPISERITHRWIQTWRERHDVILRSPTGKPAVSDVKQIYMERCVAYHLGQLRIGFMNGELNEDEVHNLDETHILLDQAMTKIYGFKGKGVKLNDVVSGTEGMTLVLRVSGGASAKLHDPFLIFANKASSYPIRGLPDVIEGKAILNCNMLIDIIGVTYRTSSKGWMTREIFQQYISDNRSMAPHSSGRKIQLYVDNCTGHTETPALTEVLGRKNIALKFLPKNSTHVSQPLDNFLIKTVKEVWMNKWQEKKSQMLQAGDFSNAPRGADSAFSGKLNNPGKLYFLSLAAAAIQEVNQRKDGRGISYARKCMIRTGLSLDIDGTWHVGQLSHELQAIIDKHYEFFDGKEPELPE